MKGNHRPFGTDELCQAALAGLFLALLVLFVFAPLSELFVKAFSGGDDGLSGFDRFTGTLSDPALRRSFWNSLWVSMTSSSLACGAALLTVLSLYRTRMPGKPLVRGLALLPLFAPTMMHGIALVYLFGNKGLVTGLGWNIGLYGPKGIVLAEILYVFPQAFLILSAALEISDRRLYEAAETLGAGTLKRFWTVTLPGLRYALLNAFFSGFTLSFTDFGAPKVVGGNFNVLATDIYKQVIGQQNLSMGAVIGLLLLGPAVAAFLAERAVSGLHSATVSSNTVPVFPSKNPLAEFFALSWCSLVGILSLSVVGAVLVAALVKVWPYDLRLTLDHFLFRNVAGYGLESYKNSLFISVVTAILGTAAAFGGAYLVEKTKSPRPIREAARFLALLPLALPGLVIGLSYIFLFNRPAFEFPGGFSLKNPLHVLYGTPWILVAANIVHFFSVPFLTAVTAMRRLDPAFESVSATLGVPLLKTFRRVTLPLCFPALLEIGSYFFVNAMVTISAVVFLYPPSFKPAALAIVNMEDAGDIAPAAAMSVLFLVTNIAVRAAYGLLAQRVKKKSELWLGKERKEFATA